MQLTETANNYVCGRNVAVSKFGHHRASCLGTMQRNFHLEPTDALGGTIGIFKTGFPTVLIVESQLRLRSALNANFLRHGWHVTTAKCIQDCLRTIEQHIFDLVICELRMRDGDVHEVMLAISDETHVIVLTENAVTSDVVWAMRNGAFDVLLKNVSFDVLQVAATTAVEGSTPKNHARHKKGIDTRHSTTPEVLSASVMTLSELNRTHLEAALASAEGNRTNAARILGISVRTVRNKVKQYGLPPRRFI